MLKDQVIELMLENTFNLLLWQASKELRIVDHLKLTRVLINKNTCCWDAAIFTLLNLAAETSKEGLVHQQSISMEFKIKAHYSLPLH